MRRNPYTLGQFALDTGFYGRATVISEILDGRYRAVHLLGMRRIGKTSLMRRIETLVPSIFLDLQAVSGDLNRLALSLSRELRRKRARWPWMPLTDENRDPFLMLELIDEEAFRAGATIYLLCDEAEGLTDFTDKALKLLQHFVWGTNQATCTVFASAKNLTELDDKCRQWKTSPFLNNFPPPTFLGSLTDEEANALISLSQSPAPVIVDPELQAEIRFLTANHPYLIQWLCYRLWQPDNTLRPLLRDDSVPDLMLARRFEMDFDYLSDNERRILHAVSKQNSVTRMELEKQLPIPYLAAYLDGMARLGYLRQTLEGYSLGNAYLEHWLKTSAPWDAKSSISDESTLAMYQKEQLMQSIDPSVVGWGLGVLTEAVKFLFEQAGDLLKERREKRKLRTGTETVPSPGVPAQPSSTSVQHISSPEILLDSLRRKVDLGAREIELRRVESLMRQIEKHGDTVNRLREKLAGMLGPTQQIELEQQIDERQQQIAQASEELRSILERLSGQSIHVEALEGEG